MNDRVQKTHETGRIAWVISPKAAAIGSRRIQESWAGEVARTRGGTTLRIRETWVCHQRGQREKRRCWRSGPKLNINADVVQMPLSLCRADCGFGARRPEFEPWLCHSLAVWPLASCLASQKLSVLTSKIRVNSNYIFSCLINCLSPTGLQLHTGGVHMGFFFLIYFIYLLFIYLFGSVGSSFLYEGFL